MDGLVVKRNPAERALEATPVETDFTGTSPSGDVLVTNGLYGLTVKPQVFTASRGQSLKLERRQELSLSTPGQHRHVVEIVPNPVHRPRHTEQVIPMLTVFDAILIGDD